MKRVRFEASGNVSIGSTSDSNRLLVSNATNIDMSQSGAGQFRVEGNGYSFAIALNGTGVQMYQNSTARDLIWGNNETEQMRLTSSGELLLGTTSVAATVLDGTGGSNNAVVIGSTSNAYPVLALQSSHQNWLAHYITNDGSLRTYNTTANYETQITDTSGRVTFPKQPHIFGTLTNTGGSGIANSYSDLAASSRSNLTVNTVSGQKRFTADVAGVYLVSITTIMDQTSVRKDTAIYHNGTKIGQTLNDEASGFHYRCWTHTIEMAANDYILVESDDWYDPTTTNTVWRRISMTLLS